LKLEIDCKTILFHNLGIIQRAKNNFEMIIHQFSQWISDCHQSDTKVPGMLELFEKGICLVDGVAEDAFYLNNEYSLLMLLV